MNIFNDIAVNPFVTTVIVGLIWPLIQAALDRPWWTKRRRIVLVLSVAGVMSVAVWSVSAYPWAWEMIVTQATMILGIAWTVYQTLAVIRINGVRLIDWIGLVTPGESAPIEGHHNARDQ